MKLIAISEHKHPRLLKKRLREENELLLTSDDRPVAVLLNVEAADDPENLLRAIRDSRSRLALSRIREAARLAGMDKMSTAQIDEETAAVRRRTRKERRH